MSVNVPINADINAAGFEQVKRYLIEIGRQAGMSEKEIDDMSKSIENSGKASNKATQDSAKGIGEIRNVAKAAGTALLATFSVQLLVNFQKHVFRVTAEFQKMEAILTNSLGSKSAAQLAMRQIVDFASRTPFAVGELTDAFIKLNNQGFKPSLSEMRKLGDLASSTGKSFDQLAEAIIDAQVGEFERLKEFGIRSQKEGDKVKFTFKGVQTQVEYTEKAMRAYILSLGDVEGVSGSMAAISETVSGKVSNLGDNIDQLSLAIGNKQTGVYAATLDWLNDFLALATLATQSTYDLWEATRQLNQAQAQEGTIKEVDFLIEKLGTQLSKQEAINRAIDLTKQSYEDLRDNIDPTGRGITKEAIDAQQVALEEYRQVLLKTLEDEEKRGKVVDKAAEAAAKKAAEEAKRIASLGIIGKLEYEISQLQKERVLKQTPAEIALIDARIAKRREEIAVINLMAQDIVAKPLGNPFDTMDKDTQKAFDNIAKNQRKAFDESIKTAQKWLEDTKNITQRAKDFWREFSDEISWTALDLYMNIEERGRMNTEREVSRLDEEKQRKQELAGQDKDQQILIEEEFQAKKEALRAKERARLIREAILQRGLTLFNIFRNTSEAAIAALAPPPIGFGPVAGIPASIGIKALGVIQAAAVLAAPLPKFAKGVYNLDGPGTDTSDSITARLSRGESVVPAAKSRAFKDIIKPIIEDEHMNYEKLLGIVLDKVPMSLRGDLFRPVKTPAGDARVLQELQGIKQAIKGQQGAQIVIDQAGVSVREKRRARVIEHTKDFLHG